MCEARAISREGGRLVTDRQRCAACGSCAEACPAEARAIVGRELSTEQVMEEVSKDRVFYDQSGGGVTFSGGEPFLQSEFLMSLLEAARARRIHTAVDTSGYVAPEAIRAAAELADLFLYDIKTLDEAKHLEFTGVSNAVILENLRWLAGAGSRVIVRVPIIPKVSDGLAEIRHIGRLVAGLGGIDEIHVLPYHKSGIDKYRRLGRPYSMEYAAEPSAESLEEIAAELSGCVPRVVIGG